MSEGFRYATIGLSHGSIYPQNRRLIEAGCELVAYWGEEPDQLVKFGQTFPQARRAESIAQILEDESIAVVFGVPIHSERADLGIAVMRHGKDFLVGKPGVTTRAQLEEVRKVQQETGRKYTITCGERLEDRATIKALEICRSGRIGQIVQYVGIGPHQENNFPRPQWFYERDQYGGLIGDLGTHQFDQFLAFTNSTEAEVVSARVANVYHPDHPGLQDFADFTMRGNGGTGYARLDWLSPDALGTWGDLRTFVLGTEGYMEIRKQNDIANRPGGSHLFVIDQKGTEYIDCQDGPLPFIADYVADVRDRTEHAVTQHHCFLLADLAISAQDMAETVSLHC